MNDRLHKLRVVSVAISISISAALVSCLPQPPPKARIKIELRGASADTVMDDGVRLKFERRVIVAAAGTSSTSGSTGSGSPSVRNLDVPPFGLTDQRAIHERFLSVFVSTYHRYGSLKLGPGVTDSDVDALDGESNGPNARSGVGALLMEGTLEKDGVVLPFRVVLPIAGGVVCGQEGVSGLGPLVFESDVDYAVTVLVRLEKLFVAVGAAPLIRGDTNGDGLLDSEEFQQATMGPTVRTRPVLGLNQLFEVTIGGLPLTCRLPSNAFSNLDAIPGAAIPENE